jgi:hypothetical protein
MVTYAALIALRLNFFAVRRCVACWLGGSGSIVRRSDPALHKARLRLSTGASRQSFVCPILLIRATIHTGGSSDSMGKAGGIHPVFG